MFGGKSSKSFQFSPKQSKLVIAILGSLPGVGVTYCAISLGTYLTHYCHYRVAIIEGNDHMHFSYIKRAAQVTGEADHFSVGKMDFYPMADEDIWIRLQRMSYDYVLVDYGVYEDMKQAQYARCNYRFLIGSLCEWKRDAYEEIIQKENASVEISFYLATLGQRYDIKEYYREFGTRLYGIPCICDPFLLVKDIVQFWRRFPI